MVIHGFAHVDTSVPLHEADAPLVVGANTVLADAVAAQGLQTVPRRLAQIVQLLRDIQDSQLTLGDAGYLRGEAFGYVTPEDDTGRLATEALDHTLSVSQGVAVEQGLCLPGR